MTHREPVPPASRAAHGRGESGSAYLVAILALVILTIVGLSLSLITQTEMQIGANEKSIERSFYAADSGISFAVARALIEKRQGWSELYKIQDPEGYGLRLEHLVEVSPFFPINWGPSNLSSINEENEQGANPHYQVNYAVTSVAIRRVPGTEVPLAERSVTAMVVFDPVTEQPSSFVAAGQKEQLERIKF